MSENKEEIQKKLAAEFTHQLNDGSTVPALNWRPLTEFKNEKGVTFAEYTPYLTANQIKERLNLTVGVFGWEDSFEEMSSDNGMICNLSVMGNSKSGVGSSFKTHENIDQDKTKESDSIKRAAISFGIGAYIKNIKPVVLQVVKKSNKIVYALSTDGKTQLHTNEQVNAYLNGVSIHLINMSNALKTIDKEILEANRKTIEIVWNLLK